MYSWVFFDYIDEKGNNVVQIWKNSLSNKAVAKFENRIIYLQKENEIIKSPNIKKLRGYDGLFEIKFEVNNIQYRPICCYGPDRHQVTILCGATKTSHKRHSSTVFKPRNACEIALERVNKISIKERTCEHKFD